MKQFLICQDCVAVTEYSSHSKGLGVMKSKERMPGNSFILGALTSQGIFEPSLLQGMSTSGKPFEDGKY